MKYKINIGGIDITLEHQDFDRSIDVDSLTTIDTSNLFGEHVTVSAALNRVGLLKAQAEELMSDAKLNLSVYEAQWKNNKRLEANQNGGKYKIRVGTVDVEVKLTETGLKGAWEGEKEWIELKKKYIKSMTVFNQMDALYWSIQSKDKKLSGLVSGTTPEEYIGGVVEGKVNGILIQK